MAENDDLLVPESRDECAAEDSSFLIMHLGESVTYSNLNASVGFTLEARWAGMNAAAAPVEQRTIIAIAITAGSEALTS